MQELFSLVFQVLVAMTATLSFSILFHAPVAQYPFCGITGGVGWLTYLLFIRYGASIVFASFAAALMLTVLSRSFSALRRTPVTVFLIAGIFPLVPGAGIYYTAYHLMTGDTALAALKGIETIKLAGAIVLGILLGFSLPHGIFNRLYREKRRDAHNL